MNTHALYQGNCFDAMGMPEPAQFDMVFADPPDGIGLAYDVFNDKTTVEQYTTFLRDLVYFTSRSAPICWYSFNAKWTFAMGRVFAKFLTYHPEWEGKACVQTFSFGQNCRTDLGNGHRPLWRLKHKDVPLYPDQIKVPSWRQLNGDKRAAPGGRVPLDHFDFPRVTGNSKQRRAWHPTQLHEDLVDRCIKLSTMPGAKVLDPFGGTGTTLRVCKKIDRACTLIELSKGYCADIAEEHGLTVTPLTSGNVA